MILNEGFLLEELRKSERLAEEAYKSRIAYPEDLFGGVYEEKFQQGRASMARSVLCQSTFSPAPLVVKTSRIHSRTEAKKCIKECMACRS